MLNAAVIMGVVRHLLTLGGGYLAAKIAITPDAMSAAIAALVTLVGVAWSVYAKVPYTSETAVAGLGGSSVPGGVESPVASLLAAPAATPAKRAPSHGYGLRKDGKPKAKPGRKPSGKK